MTGTVLGGRYRIEECIGAGAMGVVWTAWDRRLSRTVAVKQLSTPPTSDSAEVRAARARVLREGRMAARFVHSRAIAVFDVVTHGSMPCLVMEYLPSRSLASVLAERGPLEPAVVARIGAQIADALHAVHEAGIVHGDVKPGNVLLTDDGVAKLTDFGVSRATWDTSATGGGAVAGTPGYVAPEVARGQEPTPASDVFSLGATLYAAVEDELVCGHHDNTLAVLHAVAEGRLRPATRAGVLGRPLAAMLRLDPDGRPSTLDVREALDRRGGTAALPAIAPIAVPDTGAGVPAPPEPPQPGAPEPGIPDAGAGGGGAAPRAPRSPPPPPPPPLAPGGGPHPAPSDAGPATAIPDVAPTDAASPADAGGADTGATDTRATDTRTTDTGTPSAGLRPVGARPGVRRRRAVVVAVVVAVVLAAAVGAAVAAVGGSGAHRSGATLAAPAAPSVPPLATPGPPIAARGPNDQPVTEDEVRRIVAEYSSRLVEDPHDAWAALPDSARAASGHPGLERVGSGLASVDVENVRVDGDVVHTTLRFVTTDGRTTRGSYRVQVARGANGQLEIRSATPSDDPA